MRHWLQLATRNWRAKPGRTLASLAAIALGVGTVVTVTGFYESIRRAVSDQVVDQWLGRSHVTVQAPAGHWGNVPQRLGESISKLSNVQAVTYRLLRRVNLVRPGADPRGPDAYIEVDGNGVLPGMEGRFREMKQLEGRRIRAGERGVALIEGSTARELKLSLSDPIQLEFAGAALDFTLIGIFERQRVAEFQRAEVQVALEDLQELKREPGTVTIIDVMLADTSPDALQSAAEDIKRITVEERAGVQVMTAAARLAQLREAERLTQLILILVAFIALLTSFFIIVTTMSVGMIERLASLGMMRCVGVTRAQLGALVSAELMPIGVVGTLLGIPFGIALTRLGALFVPQYVQEVAVSTWGIRVAVIGGLLTTLIGGLILIVQAGRVSPLAAANPEARPTRHSTTVIVAVLGLLSLAAHQWMIARLEPARWFEPWVAFVGTLTVHLAYVLLIPALVMLVGRGLIAGLGRLLGLNRRLARDQIGRAPWRSAGICWMLMVGLSLIVYLAVRGESVVAAWDFPSKLAEAFVWTQEGIPRAELEKVRTMPGVGECTAIHNIVCEVGARKTSLLQLLKPMTMFIAGEAEVFLTMAKLEFLEGDKEEALRKFKQGGYVLLPPESSRGLNLHYGDRVDVTLAGRTATFEVAGVIQSPALDIAVSYFQADSYMTLASSGSLLGSLDDVRDTFLIDEISTFLLNFKLPPIPPPDEFKADAPPQSDPAIMANSIMAWASRLPTEADALAPVRSDMEAIAKGEERLASAAQLELNRYRRSFEEAAKNWGEMSPAERWDLFREQLVMRRVALAVGQPNPIVGSLRRLKQSIDRDIRSATLLISIIPLIALIVAALGVANLITVSVNARTRQIAVLRAVGALKSQIVRLVLAEVLTLGLLGSLAGITLGFHTAHSMNSVTQKLVGMQLSTTVPWGRVLLAGGLTVFIALLAGIAPARHAARNNVVDALQAT